MNRTGYAILKYGAILLLVAFFGYQLYASLYNPLTTGTAIYYEVDDGIDITGVIIRDETVLEANPSGVLHYVISDGERVAKGGVIAQEYDSEAASIALTEISALEEQIKNIEEIQNYNDISATDIDLVNTKMNAALSDLIFSCSAADFSSASELSAQLLNLLNRRQIITGEAENFNTLLASLKTELSSLEASVTAVRRQITSPESGYFVSAVDGYETVLKTDDLASLTPEKLESVQPLAETGNQSFGKIVSDYTWYIAASIPVSDSLQLRAGDKLKLKTPVKASPELTVEVVSVNVSEASEKAVVVFSCQEMNRDLARLRSGPMTIILQEYSGLRVSSKSLRVQDGATGVFVVSGMQVKFVPVEVLYSTGGYVICKIDNESDNALRLYDEVVEKGKGLYDGKIIR